jgi:hypothetical protein
MKIQPDIKRLTSQKYPNLPGVLGSKSCLRLPIYFLMDLYKRKARSEPVEKRETNVKAMTAWKMSNNLRDDTIIPERISAGMIGKAYLSPFDIAVALFDIVPRIADDGDFGVSVFPRNRDLRQII